MSSIKISTKIQSFQDVQKSLQDIEKYLNKLEKAIQSPAELEVTDKDGKTGDIKTTKNVDGSYTFEIRTIEGWKTPVFQEHPIAFKEKLSSHSKKKLAKSISDIQTDDTTKGTSIADKTIFDEKSNKFVIPRPDYDSGWTVNASDDAATTLEHNLNTTDFSIIDIQVSNSSTGSNATWLNAGNNLNNANRFGYIVQVVDSNNIKVGVGENGAAKFHCDGMEWENTESTHFRLRIWK